MDLINLIENYKAYDDLEQSDKESFLFFLKSFNKEERAIRDNLVGHLASSAWVVNQDMTKVLFAYHNIYDSWAWLGGHADGDLDLVRVAEKEAKEESGIKRLKLLQELPIAIDVSGVKSHIKKGKKVSNHLHFGVTYLFQSNENEILKHAEGENSDVSWILMDELMDKVSEEHMKPIYARIIEKLKNIK